MEIKEAQKQSFKILEGINKALGTQHKSGGMMLSLIEEVGEVARELSKKQSNYRGGFSKEELGDELSDVISRVFVIAEDNGIEIEEAFVQKLNKVKERFKLE